MASRVLRGVWSKLGTSNLHDYAYSFKRRSTWFNSHWLLLRVLLGHDVSELWKNQGTMGGVWVITTAKRKGEKKR